MKCLEQMKFYDPVLAKALLETSIEQLRRMVFAYGKQKNSNTILLSYALKTLIFNEYYAGKKTALFLIALTKLGRTTVYKYIQDFDLERKEK